MKKSAKKPDELKTRSGIAIVCAVVLSRFLPKPQAKRLLEHVHNRNGLMNDSEIEAEAKRLGVRSR